MRHYEYLSMYDDERIFFIPPSEIERDSEKNIISHALGALLYSPAIKSGLAEDIINKKYPGLKSIAICLEDAIGDKKIEAAEKSVISILKKIGHALKKNEIQYNEIPFLFMRIRNPAQMMEIVEKSKENLKFITGFIFPKFSEKNGEEYFEILREINKKSSKPIYGMPILETSEIMFQELRIESLQKISEILNKNSELVLNIRIGATDFANIFGIRRGYDINIYNISILNNVISDIINFFGRVNLSYVISGPVWEYFSSGERVMKPQLRQTPFSESYGKNGHIVRKKIIDEHIDGLLYEVVLDKSNGLWGKTIIHPTHIIPVQSLYAVTHEEYIDAISIINNNNGEIGVLKSNYKNKMNEIKTHLNWANKVVLRSKIYGVLNEGKIFTDLFPKYKEI